MPDLLAYLRLVRFSLAPSLVADVAAGAASVTAAAGWDFLRGFRALPASFSLFVGGMALNAWVDRDEDARTRPDRPVPSGRTPAAAARALALIGLVAAAPLAFLVGDLPLLMPAAGLALLIAGYHTPIRRHPLAGPLLLGTIRAGNVGLGILAAGGELIDAWPLLAGYGIYVSGASLVAHQEDRSGGGAWVVAGLTLCPLAVLSLFFVGLLESAREGAVLGAGLAVCTAVYGCLSLPRLRPVRSLALAPERKAAWAGALLGRMPLVLAVATFAPGFTEAGAVAFLAYLLVRLLVRWIPPT